MNPFGRHLRGRSDGLENTITCTYLSASSSAQASAHSCPSSVSFMPLNHPCQCLPLFQTTLFLFNPFTVIGTDSSDLEYCPFFASTALHFPGFPPPRSAVPPQTSSPVSLYLVSRYCKDLGLDSSLHPLPSQGFSSVPHL